MNKTQLAEHLGCSKGYVSQLLSEDYDHKMSKFMELSLAIGKIPQVTFVSVDQYLENESKSYSTSTTNDAFTFSYMQNNDEFINAA